MIPSRVRSNSNWLVLFKLNPVDLDNVFKDVIVFNRLKWDQFTDFAYTGGDDKKYNSIGIWVERDKFFLNFKPVEFN